MFSDIANKSLIKAQSEKIDVLERYIKVLEQSKEQDKIIIQAQGKIIEELKKQFK